MHFLIAALPLLFTPALVFMLAEGWPLKKWLARAGLIALGGMLLLGVAATITSSLGIA